MKALKTTMAIAAVALLFATACNDKDTEWVTAPSISPTSAVVTAPDEGGSVSLTYTVSNPVDGATTTATASASWISDVSVPSEGTVAFTVDANSSLEPRTGRITITYSYTLAGIKGTASCDVTVAQSCGDEPAISVQPTAVAAGAEGGSYYFEYTIVNPSAEGSVEAATEATWITDIDTATDGKVSFTVAENTGELRESEITITYTYPGGSISDAVEVVQDFPEEGGEGSPEITVTHPAITAAIEGGSYSFEYKILHPADDGKMEVATEEEWLTDLTDADGTVSFTVEENTDNKIRSGVITLTYTYSEGSASATVTVVQNHISGFLGLTGTYICYGKAYDGETSWTLRIFEDDGSCSKILTNVSGVTLTYLIDGLVDSEVGDYEYYGDHSYSAGAYLAEDGTLHVPTQVLNTTYTSGRTTYYVGYTPCVSETSLSYSSSFPELVFTPTDVDGEWEGDYGIFFTYWTRYTSPSTSTFSGSFFDMVYATMSLEKVSDEIIEIEVSSVPAAAGANAKKSLENLEAHTAILAK